MSNLGCLALRHLFQFGDFFDIHFQKQDISMLDVSCDIPYLDDGDRGHLLDVYRLKGGAADTPTVINIHGGGLFAAEAVVKAETPEGIVFRDELHRGDRLHPNAKGGQLLADAFDLSLLL